MSAGPSPKLVSAPCAVGLDEHFEIIAGSDWYNDVMSTAQDFESGQTPSAEKPPGWDFVASMEFHNACVARPINKKELESLRMHNKGQYRKAITAMDTEWGNLRGKKVWDPSWIRDWNEVAPFSIHCSHRLAILSFVVQPQHLEFLLVDRSGHAGIVEFH